jgi:hypothetical protein
VRFWQVVSALLALALGISLALNPNILHGPKAERAPVTQRLGR